MTPEASSRPDHTRRIAYTVIAVVTLIYAVVGVLRLVRFDMTAFDAGIFDNVLWRLANGYNDVSALTGSHHFSDHMSPLMLLAVPIYAVVPHLALPILMILQAVSVGLVGVAVWMLAEQLELGEQAKRAVLLVSLAGAGAYNAAVIDIHEVGLAVGPIALTAVLAWRGAALRRYWIWPLLASLARIDIAVTVVLIGLLVRRQQPRHARIAMGIGGSVALALGIWLLANPWDGTSFAFHFAHLGIESATELPGAVLRDPIAALRPLVNTTFWGSALAWVLGFSAVGLWRAGKWIVPALPTLIIPFLGSWPSADRAHVHYWHVLLPMLAIATVFAIASSRELQRRAIYIAAFGVAMSWVLMPILKPSFTNSIDDERAVVEFLEHEYPSASVAVLDTIVPHVSTRPEVMQLPTPFACPTSPLASFKGPDEPPELVSIPTAVLDNPVTDAAFTVTIVLQEYYEPVAVFGGLEVWQLSRTPPPEVYDGFCTASAENSS